MHPALKAFFDEHASPTHASKRHAHDLLGPVHEASTPLQQQLIHYKGLLAKAEFADHDHVIDGTMEHIRQTLQAAEREVNAVPEHARNAAHAFAQLDRYMADQRLKLEAPQPTITMPPPPDKAPVPA